jgi:hypothetical protein
MSIFPVAAEVTAPLGGANGVSNLGVSAWGGDEVDVSYEASRARLIAAGYRDVERVNGDPLKLRAYDPNDAEVLLSIDPQSGEFDTAAPLVK